MNFRLFLSRRWWWTTLLVILGTAVCIRLGIWQLDRLHQRRTFNDHVESMWALPALQLTEKSQVELTTMEYRSVEVTGTYDFSQQVALRNQIWTDQNGIPRAGYHLITPLLLADGGPAVLIDRGWIPADGNAQPDDWRKYDQPVQVTLKGIIRQGQAKPELGGVPDPQLAEGQTRLNFWNVVNLERIGQQTPYSLIPIYIQPDPDPARNEPPYPYQPTIELTEGPHLGYAFQWFTFATILFVGYPFYLRKQEPEAAK